MRFLNGKTVIAAAFLFAAATEAAGAERVFPKTTLRIFDAPPSTHSLHQETFDNGEGRRYRLFSAVPTSTPPREGFPILYMLDGNAVFDLLDAELLKKASDLVIVGIGYETDIRFDTKQRALDYTPPGAVDRRFGPERVLGGGDRFLETLTGGILPSVEAGLPVDGTRRFLWGHSYGGLFTLYALFSKPEKFQGYAAISPSVGLIEDQRDTLLEQARWNRGQGIRLFLAAGNRERRSNSSEPLPDRPASTTMKLVEQLQQDGRVSVRTDILDGLGHGETLGASIPLVFDWIAEPLK